jgi:hypothetical protein
LDYYEKGGGARIDFSYTLLPDLIVQSITTNPVTPYVGQIVNENNNVYGPKNLARF